MSGERRQLHRPLSPSSPSAPALARQLASLRGLPTTHSGSSAASSPEPSPRAAQGVKRMRVAPASVHPSALAQPTRREDDVFISGAYKTQRKPVRNATHELRELRQDADSMGREIQALRAHWKQALPDQHVLLLACEAAKSKWITAQAEELNRQLKVQLLQQQLYLASLQNLVLQSPFFDQSRSKEVFEALHTPLKLDRWLTEVQRREQLNIHCGVGIRLCPGIMDRFLRPHAAKASVETPFSHTSIMCDGDFTYAANLLVCRIPHASLQAVADAVDVYFNTMQHELKTHLGLVIDLKFIENLSATSHYAQIQYENGPKTTSVTNMTFAFDVRDERAVCVTDFVDDDEAFPVGDHHSVTRHTSLALVLEPTTDERTGHPQILLQRVAITRYNLPPNSHTVHHDVQSTQQWSNGDLLLKVICQELEVQQRKRLVAQELQ